MATFATPVVFAQSMVFPDPDPTWPNPPQPTLLDPITANTQTVVTGCNQPGRNGTTNITQSTILAFPPPFFNIHGVGLPGVTFPGANVTSNPFTTTFTSGTYPAIAGSGQGDQFTYTYSQSGSTYNEKLTDLQQFVGPFSDYNDSFDSRVLVWTSTYDSSTGVQSVSFSYRISITASNSNGIDAGCSFQETASQTGSTSFNWLATSPLKIASSLPAGKAGLLYPSTVLISGGTPPYTVTATGLPPGLTANSDGTVSGTPTNTDTGTYEVSVSVTDSTGESTGPATIAVAIAPSLIIVTSLPNGTIGTPYPEVQTVSGGTLELPLSNRTGRGLRTADKFTG